MDSFYYAMQRRRAHILYKNCRNLFDLKEYLAIGLIGTNEIRNLPRQILVLWGIGYIHFEKIISLVSLHAYFFVIGYIKYNFCLHMTIIRINVFVEMLLL
jgi:hypothetical protein